MTRMTRRLVQLSLAVAAGAGCLFLDVKGAPTGPEVMVSSAEARIGRPRTPMSYAGVARRTTRRAVGVGVGAAAVGAAAYGAATYGAGAATSGCVQAVDAYGRVYSRCY